MSSSLEMKGVLSAFNCKMEDGTRNYSIQLASTKLDFYHSDPGIFSFSYFLTRCLNESDYDLVVNAGIAGSFSDKLAPGSLVRVEKDCFADIGVEEDGVFKDLFSMGLINHDQFPFEDGYLNESPGIYTAIISNIPRVRAATVNQVSSKPEMIKRIKNSYQPDIESMEGAAFFYVCKMEKKNCLQLRSVSNFVGERDKTKWDTEGSLFALGESIRQMI